MSEQLVDVILEEIRTVAGLELTAGAGFFEAGMTSRLAVGVQESLQRRLAREIPVTHLFKYPTARALAEFLTREPGETVRVKPEDTIGQGAGWTAQSRRELRASIRRKG